jgi:dTDP-4-dehydrorhamnose reductase
MAWKIGIGEGRYRSTIGNMAIRHRRPGRLFVTGGAGFLGRHIVNGPATERWEVVAPSSQGLDLRHAEHVSSTIRDWKPTAIIHTAYRLGERSSIVDASANVADAARRYGVRLVHVSSDLVFGGRPAPYTESDEPTPIIEYGRDKADAEDVVARRCPDAVIVRTSLLFGRSEMSNHELAVRDAISGRARMTFFTDEIRSPVLVDDLAAELVGLAAGHRLSGVLHLGGPEPLSRSELAIMTAHRHGWDARKLRFSTIQESGQVRPGRIELDSSLARSHGIALRGPGDWDRPG